MERSGYLGIDVIGGKLTEVNVTSPTGLVEIDELSGDCLKAKVIDFAAARAGFARPGRGRYVIARPMEEKNELSESALALDRELRRFEDLADQAARMKLNSEKGLERATEALTRAAESQERIQCHVQRLVAAMGVAREKQESDARALMARAEEIANRRKEFAEVLQRMAALGKMAKEVQDALQAGSVDLTAVQDRMQRIADEAGGILQAAQEKEMEDVARQAEVLQKQVLSARNKVSLLAGKPKN